MTLEELKRIITELAAQKHWGSSSSEINFGEKVALLHGEISEALEAYRKNNINGSDGVAEELADAMIRIIHLACLYNIDLETAILKKIEINKNRDWGEDQLEKDRHK